MQTQLIALGYLTGKADGEFGYKTYQALLAFQRANRLKADGIAGAQTLSDLTERRLRETLATARTLSREPGVHRLVSDTLEGLVREALSERSAALPRLKLPGTFHRRQNPGAGEK